MTTKFLIINLFFILKIKKYFEKILKNITKNLNIIFRNNILM